MKKLIINIGQTAIVGASYQNNGKTSKLSRVFELNSFDYYNNYGVLDMAKAVKDISNNLPRSLKKLDITLILPSYAADISYEDTIVDNYPQEEPHEVGPKKLDTKRVLIGENQTQRIAQKIVYNQKTIMRIVNQFYKAKLNVVRAVNNACCYHNFMSIYNSSNLFEHDPGKIHICTVWGTSKITYIIMVGNLPVECRVSDIKMTNMYEYITTMNADITMSQMFKIIDTFQIAQSPEAGAIVEADANVIMDGKRQMVIPDETVDLVKTAFHDFITDMVQDIKSTYDYVRNKYSSTNVSVCTNSKLLDECLCKILAADFPIEYCQTVEDVSIYGECIQLRTFPELTDKYAPILGCVIETIKKGGDFYEF